MLPNFLVIGGQRCGSTWLGRQLSKHADVFVSEQKELEFFSYGAKDTPEGLEEYRSHFAATGDAGAVGEATPSYFWTSEEHPEWLQKPDGFSTDIPERVHRTLGGDVRLLLIVRNPVHRAISAFMHHVRRGRLNPEMGVLAAGRKAGSVHIGFYGAHLSRWLDAFALGNLWITTLDDAAAAPEQTIRAAYGALGVDETFTHAHTDRVANAGLPVAIRDGSWYADGAEGEAIETAGDIAKLYEIYREDTALLASLIDRPDLPDRWAE